MNIVVFSLMGRFPSIAREPVHISKRNRAGFFYFNLNKIFWNDLIDLKLVTNVRGIGSKFLMKIANWISIVFFMKKNVDLAMSLFHSFVNDSIDLDETERPLKITNRLFFRLWSSILGVDLSIQSINCHIEDKTFTGIKKCLPSIKKMPMFRWLSEITILKARETNADVICFEITNLTDLISMMILSEKLKRENPEKKIILLRHWYENFNLSEYLGSEAFREFIIGYVDYYVISKAHDENVILDLVSRNIQEGNDNAVRAVNGLGGIQNGFVFFNDRNNDDDAVISDIRFYKDLTRHVFFDEDNFNFTLARRECHWNRCDFCIQNSKYPSGNNKYTLRLNQLSAAIEQFGYNHITFLDEAVNADELRHLVNFFLSGDKTVYWNIRSVVSRELADTSLLSEAYTSGLRDILFGQESFNPETCKKMKKIHWRLNREEIFSIYSAIAAMGINIYCNLILMYPGQTLKDIISDINDACHMNEKFGNTVIFNFNIFCLYFGSRIYKRLNESGEIENDVNGDNVPMDRINTSGPFMNGHEQVRTIINNCYRKFYSVRKLKDGELSLAKYLYDSGFGFRKLCNSQSNTISKGAKN